jgi:hypothetical protein
VSNRKGFLKQMNLCSDTVKDFGHILNSGIFSMNCSPDSEILVLSDFNAEIGLFNSENLDYLMSFKGPDEEKRGNSLENLVTGDGDII